MMWQENVTVTEKDWKLLISSSIIVITVVIWISSLRSTRHLTSIYWVGAKPHLKYCS